MAHFRHGLRRHILGAVSTPTARDLRSVVGVLVKAGASADGAERIVRLLLESGLTAREARDWLTHRRLAYPHPLPAQQFGSVSVPLVGGAVWCLSQGHEDVVLNSAIAFAAASPAERLIARLFGGNTDDVRRLTDADPDRIDVVAAIASLLHERLGDPIRVAAAASARELDGREHIRDRIRQGAEAQLLRDLQTGAIDADLLAASRRLDPTW